ncbi:MAG: undecaprenyl/decaprenyl-phosphate alpha-N-acetylglucosaminyl 1-phosphate transferase [Proteobacteria bacterium]|nr:undecaprenyl/decaprenyl-phosphate alpha-N-acetylglucosaminyl 1-phosphate transferase [Pseudomonadota bacterium]
MRSALGAFLVAGVVAALVTPMIRAFARRHGAVEHPGERDVHSDGIPRLGGLAVVAAVFSALAVLFVLQSTVSQLFFSDPLRVVGLLGGGMAVCLLGVADDLRGVRAWHKLWVQVGAALLAFLCGYRIEGVSLPWLGTLEMGIFAAPVTVLWIVAIINALNLIDGLDGLASGVAFFVCIANFTVGVIHGHALVMLLSAALAGAIAGFLVYNFNPASIFMGDSGSMFLGYALATTSMLGNEVKSSTTIAILVPILAMGLPIMDTLFSMVRRFLERRPIFSPDRGHIHHRLLDMGLTQRRAVMILYGVCVLFAGAGVAVSIGRSWQVGGALVVLCVAVVLLVRFVGYFKYLTLKRNPGGGGHSREAQALRAAVPRALRALDRVSTVEELRAVLADFAAAAGLQGLRLRSGDGGVWEWSQPSLARSRQHVLAVDYALDESALDESAPGPAQDRGTLGFQWRSEDSVVPAAVDILLQLITDACASALARCTVPAPVPVAHRRSTADLV